MKNVIVYFDTDFIKNTYDIIVDGKSILEHVLDLPMKFNITECVFNELFPPSVKNCISQLINANKIQMMKTIDSLVKITNNCFNSQFVSHAFLTQIKTFSANQFGTDEFYDMYFLTLETASERSNIGEFGGKVDSIFNGIPAKLNKGEISVGAAVMVEELCGEADLLVFLSNDGGARKALIDTISRKLQCYTPFSIIIYLYIKKIFTQDQLRESVKQVRKVMVQKKNNGNIPYLDMNSCKKELDINKFIQEYVLKNKVSIHNNGIVKLIK